ncbi:LAGLIDADG family homing endonuclease [Ornithinimicrobium murale]|uniref:LAGLIDADG family homing endonuclease n=1 Tax=Ornithinimicrobium murale TaxID=1050153 RepID=UPI000E0DA490|nr:LAGLIDADG family homing endonuclease [Ornithinimicrobium murale]
MTLTASPETFAQEAAPAPAPTFTMTEADIFTSFLNDEIGSEWLPEPNWGPVGETVYERTYARPIYKRDPVTGKPVTDGFGTKELEDWWTWERPTHDRDNEHFGEMCRRVVQGNLSYAPRNTQRPGEELEMFTLMYRMGGTPAGRHLWVTGTGLSFSRNCWAAGWAPDTSEHFRFAAMRLFEGGGVGSNYSNDLLAVTAPLDTTIGFFFTAGTDHTDFDQIAAAAGDALVTRPDGTGQGLEQAVGEFVFDNVDEHLVVDDSREGWVATWCALVDLATSGRGHVSVLIDVSDIRPYGAPLKTFGGQASGPAPLVQACAGIANVLNARVQAGENAAAPQRLTSDDAMEIDHFQAAAVVAGGTRRSARMSLKHWADEDIFEFINCKQDLSAHWTTNISVETDSEFNLAVEDQSHPLHTHARAVLRAVAEGMTRDGEPGIVDTERHSIGEPVRVRIVNPCVTGDAWVQTVDGLRQVRDLVGKGKIDLLVDDKVWSTSDEGFFATGHREVLSLNVDGTELKVTPEHLISTPDGWRPAGDLTPGDVVDLTDSLGSHWTGEGTGDEGYLLGLLVGDGYFGPENANGVPGSAILCAWHTDAGSESVKQNALDSIELAGLNHRTDWVGWRDVHGGNKQELRSTAIRDLAARFGIVRGNKTITPEVMAASSDFQKGFLSALFDTDGHVEGDSRGGGTSVRLSQSDPEMLGKARTMLLGLGVKSVVRGGHPEQTKTMLGGSYVCRAAYRLIISGAHVERFDKTIGFSDGVKAQKLTQRIDSMTRGHYTKPMVGTVQSITEMAAEDVFDAKVPGLNAFVANGTIIHNCGEASLTFDVDGNGFGSLAGESCNLGSVNLDDYGTDFAGAERAMELVSRFLLRATMKPYPGEDASRIEARNRRIGAGIMGLHGWVLAHGVKLSDLHRTPRLLARLTDLRLASRRAADELADAMGVPRPVKTTAIAPTGSISKMSGTDPATNPTMFKYFIQNIRYESNNEQLPELGRLGYAIEPDKYAANTVVVSYPMRGALVDRFGADLVEDSTDLDFADYLRLNVAVEETFCGGEDGMAVSSTCQLAEGVTADFVEAELLNFLGKTKGVTAFPSMSGREQAPFIPLTEDEFDAEVAKLTPEAQARVGGGDSNDENCSTGACPVK